MRGSGMCEHSEQMVRDTQKASERILEGVFREVRVTESWICGLRHGVSFAAAVLVRNTKKGGTDLVLRI